MGEPAARPYTTIHNVMRKTYLFTYPLILLLLTACGYKGPVRPLETPLPGPPTVLELRQQGDSLLLGWQLPTANQNGSLLKKAPQLEIYRMTFDPENDCPECFDRSELLVRIDPELPEPGLKVGKRYLYRDEQVRAGTGYQYKLLARSANGQPGQSAILRQPFTNPVPAPGQLQVLSRDRSALLSWQPVEIAPGDQLLGYRIYRRLDDVLSSPYPLRGEPLQETHFEDFNLENGTRYHYRVRALVQRGDLQIESRASSEQSATPEPGR